MLLLLSVGNRILPTALILWNKNGMSFIKRIKKNGKIYLAQVESKRIDGKVTTKYIKYIGKEADGKTILSSSLSNASIQKVKLYGPLMLLNHLAQEISLSEILGEYGDEILSLVYAHCLDYRSISRMKNWFERTDLNMILDIDRLTEARLLSALDSLERKNPEILQREIFESVQKKYDLEVKGLIYDVTNTYLFGKKCSFAKLGKGKEGRKGKPIIQIGLGVTQKDGIPVFHKVYDGNTHDSRTFQDAITYFEEYKIQDGIFVFDRGITSKEAQIYIKKIKWKVLCGFSLTERLKKIIRSSVKGKKFIDIKNRVRLNKTTFHIVQKEYKIGSVKGKLAICFNEQQRLDLNNSLYDEIINAQLLLSNGKKIKSGLEKYFSKSGKLIAEKITQEEEFHGYSCIFTTAQLAPEQMIRHYFDKDLVEKAFQSLKGVVRLRPIRHWLYNRVIAHVFICYLSYLLLSILKFRLKKINLSPVKALRELDTLYKVYMNDPKKGFEVSRVVALSKMQEKILKTVDKKLMHECRQ
jgi:transposase